MLNSDKEPMIKLTLDDRWLIICAKMGWADSFHERLSSPDVTSRGIKYATKFAAAHLKRHREMVARLESIVGE